ETQAPIEGAEGIGCPGAEYGCNKRCRSIGYRGGYCGSLFNLRCHCY
ncbi:actinodefensin, partial [Actinomyces sp. HMSC075C01]